MNDLLRLISENLDVFLRILLGLIWGFSYGFWLHRSDKGRDFERNLTFLATIVGMGVVKFLSFQNVAAWWVDTGVLAASAVGIVVFALKYGYHTDNPNYKAHRLKDFLEQSQFKLTELIDDLHELLETGGYKGEQVTRISQVLSTTQRIKHLIDQARNIK